MENIEKLIKIMQSLRADCSWNKQQTPLSLTQYAIEEAYEVEAAIREGNAQYIKEELGDLLFQIVFQAQMYSEQGLFDFQDVINSLNEKLIRRHPHVFQKEESQLVEKTWQEIKQQERQSQNLSLLDQVKHGSALQQADQLQKVAAKIGFDFPHIQGAYEKLEEELLELQQAIDQGQQAEIFAEFGDCLFSLINIGRKLDLSTEMALLSTVHKFRTRFAFIENQAQQHHKKIEDLSLEEMDFWWEQAKQQ